MKKDKNYSRLLVVLLRVIWRIIKMIIYIMILGIYALTKLASIVFEHLSLILKNILSSKRLQ